MHQDQSDKLLEKYRNGTLTKEERLKLDAWYLYHAQSNEPLRDASAYQEQIEAMDNAFPFISGTKIKVRLWPRLAAAASIILALTIGFLFFKYDAPEKLKSSAITDVKPGGDKAYLILSDGKSIDLTQGADGAIAEQEGVTISKISGEIVYQIADFERSAAEQSSAYNTLGTPKGGQYRLHLPDGTKVWLNAASTLKFPASFARLKQRKVELNGEAYFEVAKDKSKPFLVATQKQVITVLGTRFNVNSYADETSTKTTLLEGSVQIIANSQSKVLKPGQQAEVSGGITISQVNTEQAVSWKNGYFSFDDENLGSIMRKVSRWYNVEVSFKDKALENELYAAVSTRFANVSVLLKLLEQTGDARFAIEGKKIIISNRNH